MNAKVMMCNQKKNIYNLSFENYCSLANPTDLQCKDTEKAFYNVQELLRIREWSALVGDRYSWYFIESLVKLRKKKEFISEIINEIEYLEDSVNKKTSTKIQTQFKYEPLLGLWHKHYHIGNFDNINHLIIKPLLKTKKWNRVKQELRVREKQIGSNARNVKMVISVLKKFTIDEYDRKLNNSELTGEWIIYHEYKGQKYYLGLWHHQDDEMAIANHIIKIFNDEFPEFAYQLPIFS
ncbi:hypothetical protein [Acinetobacter sp. YH12145]|uniref:hypothetical protein n=1 Tax=Acinetobacter sp. YH12145 TaxID=2601129 RepID=UPI0015D13069|nr:hypothetical protein [Acinetobacter sp. YH12145]